MDHAANDNAAHRPAVKRRCPICRRTESPDFSPFCSKRCADVDLHRWLGEGYRVPVDGDGPDDSEPE